MFFNCTLLNNNNGVDFSKWCVRKYSEVPSRFNLFENGFTETTSWEQSCE